MDISDRDVAAALRRRAAIAARLHAYTLDMADSAERPLGQFAGLDAETYRRQAAMLRSHSLLLLGRASQVRRAQTIPKHQRSPGTNRSPRSRRTVRRASARAPDDDREPERPFGAVERRGLRLLIDTARRKQLALTADWRTCARCLREQEPEEFGRGCKYCRSCERERVAHYRVRKAVVA